MAIELEIPIIIERWKIDEAMIIKEIRRMLEAGDIKLELCTHVECVECKHAFILDKRKYRIRFEDETEDSVKVVIEPND